MDGQEPITTNEIVVAFLLREAEKYETAGLSPLHINKLVFLCHGWTLGYFDKPLIENSDGDIQAWRYGPVVVDVYHKLKNFGRSLIKLDTFYSKTRDIVREKVDGLKKDYPEIVDLMGDVYYYHRDCDAGELIVITHRKDGPWDQCYVHGRRGTPIPDSIIERYYKGLIQKEAGQ